MKALEGKVGETNLAALQVGHLYSRAALHSLGLGGERQRGISYPAEGMHALLFSHAPNEEFGYQDGWADVGHATYHFSGMWFGPGAMKLARGNLAMIDRSPQLHLLLRDGVKYRYEGRFECVDYHNARGVNPWTRTLEDSFVFVLRRTSAGEAHSLDISPHADSAVLRHSINAVGVATVRPDAFEGTASDPELRRVLLEKALGGHRQIVGRLVEAFRGGGLCSEDPRSYDLLVEWADGASLLVEAKTLPSWHLGRVRLAVGQLLEYEYRLQKHLGTGSAWLAIATDRRPEPPWLLDYLTTVRKLAVFYDDAGTIRVVGAHAHELRERAVGLT